MTTDYLRRRRGKQNEEMTFCRSRIRRTIIILESRESQ